MRIFMSSNAICRILRKSAKKIFRESCKCTCKSEFMCGNNGVQIHCKKATKVASKNPNGESWKKSQWRKAGKNPNGEKLEKCAKNLACTPQSKNTPFQTVPYFYATVSHAPLGSSCMCIIQLYIHLSAAEEQLERLMLLECMVIMLHHHSHKVPGAVDNMLQHHPLHSSCALHHHSIGSNEWMLHQQRHECA